ncbi:MAG: hypothetical protein WDW36_008130 [Sanguina aurantia]
MERVWVRTSPPAAPQGFCTLSRASYRSGTPRQASPLPDPALPPSPDTGAHLLPDLSPARTLTPTATPTHPPTTRLEPIRFLPSSAFPRRCTDAPVEEKLGARLPHPPALVPVQQETADPHFNRSPSPADVPHSVSRSRTHTDPLSRPVGIGGPHRSLAPEHKPPATHAALAPTLPWHPRCPGTHAALAPTLPCHPRCPATHAALAPTLPWHPRCPATHAALPPTLPWHPRCPGPCLAAARRPSPA